MWFINDILAFFATTLLQINAKTLFWKQTKFSNPPTLPELVSFCNFDSSFIELQNYNQTACHLMKNDLHFFEESHEKQNINEYFVETMLEEKYWPLIVQQHYSKRRSIRRSCYKQHKNSRSSKFEKKFCYQLELGLAHQKKHDINKR